MSQQLGRNNFDNFTFRPEAVQRYMQGQEESVFPRLASPRAIIYLWILLGLSIALTLVVWFAEVPVYTPGLAIATFHNEEPSNDRKGEVDFILLVSPERHVQVGQQVWLQYNTIEEGVKGTIITLEPGLSSPEEILRRFHLENSTASLITEPMMVAIAHFDSFPVDSPTLSQMNYQYRIQVEVGSRKAISFLPWVGWWFNDAS